MDKDLQSIASARRATEKAWDAYNHFLDTDPQQIDDIVQAMARAIEPEAKRLGELAVEETGQVGQGCFVEVGGDGDVLG